MAVVTGATRGIDGIALSSAGAAAGVPDRSKRCQRIERRVAEDLDLTVESAAEAVTAAGGMGVGIACDLSTPDTIDAALARISDEESRIDLLVCSAFTTPPGRLRGDFWEQGTAMWDACYGVGLRVTYATCRRRAVADRHRSQARDSRSSSLSAASAARRTRSTWRTASARPPSIGSRPIWPCSSPGEAPLMSRSTRVAVRT